MVTNQEILKKGKFTTVRRLLMIFLCQFSFSPALADTQNERLHPLPDVPLQMRTLENPPLAYTNDDGEVTGILVEGIREAVRRTGHEVEFAIYPWKRVLKEVSEGNADAAFNAGKTAEREQWGRYHQSVLMDETYVFFANKPMTLSPELTEAPELRVGIQLGYYYGERFDEMLKDPPFKSLEVSQTIPRNLKLLEASRTHVFIGDLLPTMHYVKDMGMEDAIHIVRNEETGQPLVVSTSPTYVAFSRRTVDPAYVEKFNTALDSMKEDETFESILNTYMLNVPDLPQ